MTLKLSEILDSQNRIQWASIGSASLAAKIGFLLKKKIQLLQFPFSTGVVIAVSWLNEELVRLSHTRRFSSTVVRIQRRFTVISL